MANAQTLRWIFALAGAALVAVVVYAALRFGGSVSVRPAEPGAEGDTGIRMTVSAAPGAEEARAASAAVAEETAEGQLVLAARNGEIERVRGLLDDGLPADAREARNGHLPLHQAAAERQTAVVELLLAEGADPEARDGAGQTALMRAAAAAAVDAGRLLLDAGAEVNARSEPQGNTPVVQVAMGSVQRRFLEGDPDSDAPGKEAELEFARMLFDRGADPNLQSEQGSPLKVLAISQQVELLSLFVERGARTDGDPQLALLARIPGPIGEAIRRAMADESTDPASEPPGP